MLESQNAYFFLFVVRPQFISTIVSVYDDVRLELCDLFLHHHSYSQDLFKIFFFRIVQHIRCALFDIYVQQSYKKSVSFSREKLFDFFFLVKALPYKTS